MEILDTLKTLPAFSGFSPEELEYLAQHIQQTQYAEGQAILQEGTLNDAMYILVNGIVEIRKKFGGQEVVVAELMPGNFLGEGGLLAPEAKKTTVMAIAKTPAEALVIHRSFLETAAQEMPMAAIKLLRSVALLLSQKVRSVDEAYVKLFMESRGIQNISELQELQGLLAKEWSLPEN